MTMEPERKFNDTAGYVNRDTLQQAFLVPDMVSADFDGPEDNGAEFGASAAAVLVEGYGDGADVDGVGGWGPVAEGCARCVHWGF